MRDGGLLKAVTDEQPVKLAWSVLGDMPEALKDGVACWTTPDALWGLARHRAGQPPPFDLVAPRAALPTGPVRPRREPAMGAHATVPALYRAR